MSQSHVKPDHDSTTSTPPDTPRWVKVFGLVIAIVILLFVILLFVGGGSHGPRRHIPSAGAAGYTSPIAYGGQQP